MQQAITPTLEDELDRLQEKWFELRSLRTKFMVQHNQEKSEEYLSKMREIENDEVKKVAKLLGFTVEFRNTYNPRKIWLKKKKSYSGLAFFEAGRLKTIIKAKRTDQMQYHYTINGQAWRGCENIYWRRIAS